VKWKKELKKKKKVITVGLWCCCPCLVQLSNVFRVER
jgi:hypothetical protein